MFRILRYFVKSSRCCAVGGTYRRAANTLNRNNTIANRKISFMSSYLSSSLVFQYPTNQYRMMSDTSSTSKSKCPSTGTPLLTPAGSLFDHETIMNPTTFASSNDHENELAITLLPKDDENLTEHIEAPESEYFFIPQVKLHDGDGSQRKRVLVLCTGGTLTMAPNPDKVGRCLRYQELLQIFLNQC